MANHVHAYRSVIVHGLLSLHCIVESLPLAHNAQHCPSYYSILCVVCKQMLVSIMPSGQPRDPQRAVNLKWAFIRLRMRCVYGVLRMRLVGTTQGNGIGRGWVVSITPAYAEESSTIYYEICERHSVQIRISTKYV